MDQQDAAHKAHGVILSSLRENQPQPGPFNVFYILEKKNM